MFECHFHYVFAPLCSLLKRRKNSTALMHKISFLLPHAIRRFSRNVQKLLNSQSFLNSHLTFVCIGYWVSTILGRGVFSNGHKHLTIMNGFQRLCRAYCFGQKGLLLFSFVISNARSCRSVTHIYTYRTHYFLPCFSLVLRGGGWGRFF